MNEQGRYEQTLLKKISSPYSRKWAASLDGNHGCLSCWVHCPAIDTGWHSKRRREGQKSSDSAALAGAGAGANWLKANSASITCPLPSGMESAIIAAATSYANSNGGVSITQKSLASATATNGVAVENCNSSTSEVDIHIRITTESENAISGTISNSKIKNVADSIARIKGGVSGSGSSGGAVALLALDPSSSSALSVTGNGTISVIDGLIKVNSNNASAVSNTGNGSLVAKDISAFGGLRNTGNGSINATGTIEIGKV